MSQGALQNLLVCRASRDFGNRNHIMARFAQRPQDRPGAAFEQVLERALGHVPRLRRSRFYIPRAQRLRAGLKYVAPTALEETQMLPSHPSAYALG